jgi:hypothetical protein
VVRPPPALTTAAAIEEFIEGAEQGRAVNRSGRRYRPSALRDLTGILRYHVAPELGELPLREVRRSDIQALVDRLAEEQLSESRIRSVISALRALYGYAIEQQYVEFNPADGLVMPRGDEPPRSEHQDAAGPEEDSPFRRNPTWSWEDPPSAGSRQRSRRDEGTRAARKPPRRSKRDRGGYEPIAVLPERILSFALRAVFLLFVVVALISLLQPA